MTVQKRRWAFAAQANERDLPPLRRECRDSARSPSFVGMAQSRSLPPWSQYDDHDGGGDLGGLSYPVDGTAVP